MVVGVVAGMALAGPAALASSSPSPSRQRILRLLTGVPQSGPRLGVIGAPVRVTVYGDLECPICRAFFLSRTFARMVASEVRTGRVSVRYRSLLTATPRWSRFERQQVAALAAGDQKRFWQYALIFLSDQGSEWSDYVTEAFLDRIARQVPGLSWARWKRDRLRRRLSAEVQRDQGYARRGRIDATPTFIFRGSRRPFVKIVGIPTYRQIERALHAVS